MGRESGEGGLQQSQHVWVSQWLCAQEWAGGAGERGVHSLPVAIQLPLAPGL